MSAFATNDDKEISPAEWEEFLENINFNEKIHKILAMDTDEGKKSYLVWWNDRDIEDSTWIPIPHFIKKYGPEAEKEMIKFKDKQAIIAREKSSPSPEWSSLPYARIEKSKVYQRQYKDFDREHETEPYPMDDMPKLSDKEYQSLIRVVGNYTWGGRRSRKKKRTRKRKRKTKRKRKKKRRKRKRTKKKRRRR